MNEMERNHYIFGNHRVNKVPVNNRFGWLEEAFAADIQTIIETKRRARRLVKGGGNVSISIIVCTGLETISALYTGNTKILCGRAYNAEDNVKRFVDAFFPSPAREIPRLMWDMVRNGADHFFMPKSFQYSSYFIRLTFYAKAGMKSYVTKNNNIIIIHWNSIEFYDILKRVIRKYKLELQGTQELQENFIKAWDSVEQVQKITNQQQRPAEARQLLSRLRGSNQVLLFQ